MRLHAQAEAGQASEAQRRTQIENRMQRLRDLYELGDVERAEYQQKRDPLLAELATLTGAEDQRTVLERMAAFLADLPAAWEAASQEQRNRLLRLLFQTVRVEN